jgi:hypothetical protein
VKTLRILLAVRPVLFRDALHILLARRGRLEVIDVEPRSVEILVAAWRHRVDVAVVTLEPTPEIPPLVTHLLTEFPAIRVLGIDLEGQCARIYRNGYETRLISCSTASEIVGAIVTGE